MLLCCHVAAAQKTERIFKHITTSQGLITNNVGMILQDSKGFIWIATQTGLQRYDGKRFKNYYANVRDTAALQTDWIINIFEDSKQRLWIGPETGGPYLLDRKTQKFYNFGFHVAPGMKKPTGIWQILEDKQGHIWLAAKDAYYKLNDKTYQFEPMADLLNMPNNVFPSSMSMDKKGNLWFATTGGVKQLTADKNRLFERSNNPDHLAVYDINGQVGNIVFDDSNNIWVNTGFDCYLYRYNIGTDKVKQYSFNKPGTGHSSMIRNKEYLSAVFICSNGELIQPLISRGLATYNYQADSFSIINARNTSPNGLHIDLNSFSGISAREDNEKNIWLSSDAGINIYNLDKPHFETYGLPSDVNTWNGSEVSDFCQTADGDIYVSYYFVDGGIKRFDKNLNFKKHYLISERSDVAYSSNQLWNLFQDDKAVIWAPSQAATITQLSADRQTLSILNDTALFGNINQIQQDADKNIWIAYVGKGLAKIDASTKKVTRYKDFAGPQLSRRKRVNCFLFDDDKIWVGTDLNGLQLFDKTTGSFVASFVADEKNKQSISNNQVSALVAYNADTLIVGTYGGLNIFSKKTKTFTTISSKEGLPNNLVQALQLDNQKNLWVAFAGGLSNVNIRNHAIINYDASDGVINNRFNHRILKLQDGRLMIAASESFLVFDPESLIEKVAPPEVTITDFKVFGQPLLIDSILSTVRPIELNYYNNSISIEFAALQFHGANKMKYYYQLEGVDKDWILADDDQSVPYNQLVPGNYIFKVKCANRDGLFSDKITTLSINIIPPFWKRWWFLSLMVLLAAFALYIVIKWRERNIRTIEAGKTTMQQLTAEKYKTQFESEQISSFFSTSLFNKTDVDDVLWDVAKNLIGKLGFVDCMIYLWNEDKTKLIQRAGYGPKGSMEELEKQRFDVEPGQGIVGAVAQSGEALIVPDTTADSRYRVDDMERLSEICVPIKYNEQLIGVIDSEHYEKNFFTRQHLHLLTTIATLIAAKIKSIESEQSLRHQKAELVTINQQLAEVQLAALRSQMNPHFIFNALNSIKKFVIANEPANAEKYLGKFSKLIRLILDNSQTSMVTVLKEVQLLKLYLDLEQLRFGTKLSYEIIIDESLEQSDVQIPSMIVQPFVENSMLHGIMHLEDAGKVTVQFLLHDDWLEIIIEDNGVGRAKSVEYKSKTAEPHHSIGIKVATKRLEALKKTIHTPTGIEIVDLMNDAGEGLGTKVIISIPVY